MNTRTFAGVLAIIVMLALAGCSFPISAPAPVPASPASVEEPAGTEPAASPSRSPRASPSPSASAGPGSLGPVVATRTGSVQGGSIELQLYRIVRVGRLAHLTLTVRSSDGVVVGTTFSEPGSAGYEADGITLIDAAHEKLYLVASHGDSCICTATGSMTLGDQPAVVAASFAAPPSGVTEMDVQIPHFGIFPHVPVV